MDLNMICYHSFGRNAVKRAFPGIVCAGFDCAYTSCLYLYTFHRSMHLKGFCLGQLLLVEANARKRDEVEQKLETTLPRRSKLEGEI